MCLLNSKVATREEEEELNIIIHYIDKGGMVNFHTNAEMVVLLFLYIYCLYDIIRKIIIFIVFIYLILKRQPTRI